MEKKLGNIDSVIEDKKIEFEQFLNTHISDFDQQISAKVNQINQELESKRSNIDGLINSANQNNNQINEILSNANSKLTNISNTEGQVNQINENIKQTQSNVNEKQQQIDSKIEQLDHIESDLLKKQQIISKTRQELDKLIAENKVQSKTISEILQKATAGSAVSLSLEAYRDFIKRESQEKTKDDVIPIISQAIEKIFKSPLDSQGKSNEIDNSKSVIEQLVSLVNTIKN